MSRYEAQMRQEELKRVAKVLETDPAYKFNIWLHRGLLRAQLKLERDKYFSNQTSRQERAKNEYHYKTRFINRILGLKKPKDQQNPPESA